MRWYADNSELHGFREAQIPDILLFGGVAVPEQQEADLRNAIESVKEGYTGHKRTPVKWNMKDLKRVFCEQQQESLYEETLASSKEWRREIIQVAAEFDISVLVGCIQSHSANRMKIKQTRRRVSQLVFSNTLMRLALCAQERKSNTVQVVLDWPDKGESKPFDREYAAAFNHGRSKEDAINYYSGPLRELGFLDSVVYCNMLHSTVLQLSDLVVGAVRELIECALGKREAGLGVELVDGLRSSFYGAPDKILGRGLNLSGADGFKERIGTYLDARP